MPTPANTVKALDPYWDKIVSGIDRAERNLTELEPLTTQAHGADQTETDQHAINRCVRLIRTEIERLHGLISKYNYPTAGESTIDINPRETSEMWENKHALAGCVNCGQKGVMIYNVVAPNSADLCSWCMKFKQSTGFHPTPTLLIVHDQGRKMTQALVDRELAPHREAQKALLAKTKTKRRRTTKRKDAA